ncbi:hypothetical protein, partial [uncultured Akkermansia sp.]|uniref:hypothetical protein n=1 Tax=uncultured Akkermansia sp. TaxID=512294 RepID=UPI002604ED07
MSDGGGIGPARRRRRKEENSWVDKSTIKFEILRESPAFVILELHGNGFSPACLFAACCRVLSFGFPLLHPSRRGKGGGMTAFLFAAEGEGARTFSEEPPQERKHFRIEVATVFCTLRVMMSIPNR